MVSHEFSLLAAGICSTDLELQRGYYNFSGTPGHEFVGEAAEAADKNVDWETRRWARLTLGCGALRLVQSAASAAIALREPSSASSSILEHSASS